jgi:hypothetical protein
MPYLNRYLPDLDNGIFESHLHDLNFTTPIWQSELDERLLSYYNSYNKQGNMIQLYSH